MDTSVIVVGAGPAGLMLAGELRIAGAEVIVLERLPERTGESRGLGLTTRTMEVFDQRGLLSRLGEVETSNQGHFGGLAVDFGVLEGAHAAARTVPQSRTEEALEEWATELGADIRRGSELLSFEEGQDRVEVSVRGPEGMTTLSAAYLVGCDGGRSVVRKAARFDFPGTAATRELFLADVRGLDLEPHMIGRNVPGGMVIVGPLGDGIDRIIVGESGAPPRRRTGPPPFDEVAAAWQRLMGTDISHGRPVWVSSFSDAARQVTEYRRGRVFLAGDAAHVHLPAGGQGMNTSIQDSVNLGWKLASVVRGTTSATLLDTYHSERHPVGRRLITNTLAQGLLILNGDEVQPLRDVLSELIGFDEVSRHLAGMVSGLEIRYDVGPGPHPLLGQRMPHLELVGPSGKTSSTQLLRTGHGILLDLADDAALRGTAAAWSGHVDTVNARPHALSATSPLRGTAAVLVRPDGHIAWTPESEESLPTTLSRWFGPSR
ncbi:FAD-dependent monooxygenase [Streptomyces sp. RKAG290]|uniref:FAD-dependent monooxygenase n=1 Tax=Streptomyces sp. RKAG290 TaxID=2888348 RepID=UPI00203469AC|nr:FAD-dependent monooxygenase [Streptomyces sp. RKAG290]MCM2414268.1 FAD-dependent monooxygenase [Streptomyces sp. RKAG290]